MRMGRNLISWFPTRETRYLATGISVAKSIHLGIIEVNTLFPCSTSRKGIIHLTPQAIIHPPPRNGDIFCLGSPMDNFPTFRSFLGSPRTASPYPVPWWGEAVLGEPKVGRSRLFSYGVAPCVFRSAERMATRSGVRSVQRRKDSAPW